MPSFSRTTFLYPDNTPQGAYPLSFGTKPDAAQLDYTLDASPFLADASNDTIVVSTATVTCVSNDLTLSNMQANAYAITIDISGGIAGTTYSIIFRFQTFESELIVERAVPLEVVSSTVPPAVNNVPIGV